MNVIILNKSGRTAKNISLSSTLVLALVLLSIVLFSSLTYSIYQLNQPQAMQQLTEQLKPDLSGDDQLMALLKMQRQEITQTSFKAKSQVEALSLRVAKCKLR